MRNLFNQLISGAQGSAKNSASNNVFSIRPSPMDSSTTLIHPAGYPVEAPPLYTITNNDSHKPHLTIWRGYPMPDGSNIIGTANYHFTKSPDLSIHGRHVPLKMSTFSGNFTFTWLPTGKLKWKPNQLGGSSMYLYDQTGLKLAKYGSTGFPGLGGKQLEIFVPCDAYFVELALLSGIVARDMNKAVEQGIAEAAGAVAGV